MATSPVIGLIAGGGELPLLFARQAQRRGFSVRTAALRGSAPVSLERQCNVVNWISIGQLGSLIRFFKEQGVRRAVMHGKVQHSRLFKNLRLDWKALSLWSRLKDRSGEALLKAVAGELGRAGVELLDVRTFMEESVIQKGWATHTRAKSDSIASIAYGLKRARVLAREGVGQTLVVKGNAVAAVEGMEGTDEAIRRAGHWAGPGTVAIKVASPQQDWRFDIPTLGPRTLQSMIRAKAKGIVVEAGKSFLIDRGKTLALAEKNRIFILAV